LAEGGGPVIVVIGGAGGVGKGTLARQLVASDPSLKLSRSWTTRTRRPDDGPDAYTYVDRETFEERVRAGGFLEHAEFLGNLYGTPMPDPGDADEDLVLEIDVQGAETIKAEHPDALVILILAPNRDVQTERMRARGDSEDHVRRRLEMAPLEEERLRRIADAVVVNDDLGKAVRAVAGILAGRRSR
jgi:guanylate kinase